jgi:hypothetical protein
MIAEVAESLAPRTEGAANGPALSRANGPALSRANGPASFVMMLVSCQAILCEHWKNTKPSSLEFRNPRLRALVSMRTGTGLDLENSTANQAVAGGC